MKFINYIFIFPLWILSSYSWEIDLYVGNACMGQALSQTSYTGGTTTCTSLQGLEKPNSATVTRNGDEGSDYVTFYSGYNCDDGTQIEDSVFDDTCFLPGDEIIGSYSLSTQAINKRELATINSTQSDNTTDIVNYVGPAKYIDTGINTVGNVRLSYNTYYMSAAATTVATTFTGLSFYSLVSGCVGVGSASPLSQSSCITSIVATVGSFTVSVLSGLTTFATRVQHFEGRARTLRGSTHNAVKRSMIEDVSHDYLTEVLTYAGHNPVHVGYDARSIASHNYVPVYEFVSHDAQTYHISVFMDRNDNIVHSISHARNNKIVKRQDSYNSVTLTQGGIDFTVCERNSGADFGSFPSDPNDAYNRVREDLECLVSTDELGNSNYLQVDISDPHGNVAATLNMATYSDSDSDTSVYAKDTCDNTQFYFSQSCIN